MTKNILVIDDFNLSNEIVSTTLMAVGYQTFACQNGLAAIKYLKEIQMDLVITDYNMPKMNGIEFLKQIRQMPEYKTLPIVFLSSIKDPEIIKSAKNYSISAWLSKPLEVNELKNVISNIFNK